MEMGKRSRQKALGSTEEERKESGFKAWKERMSGRVHEALDGKKDMIHMQTAARMRGDKRILGAWMEYSGVTDVADIDYANPCVHIEWTCCELDLLMLATSDGERFLQETDCDRETFMRYYDQSAEKP